MENKTVDEEKTKIQTGKSFSDDFSKFFDLKKWENIFRNENFVQNFLPKSTVGVLANPFSFVKKLD